MELEERGLLCSKRSRVGCEQKLLELKGFAHFLQNSDALSKLVILAAEFHIPCVSLVSRIFMMKLLDITAVDSSLRLNTFVRGPIFQGKPLTTMQRH